MYSRIQHRQEPSEGYIKKLIAEGEHDRLDFKFGITDSRKIARTLAAFANTQGGKLLVGVKDNGAIAGVRSEEEYYMVEAASQLYTKPVVPFDVAEWSVDGKDVLEISVSASTNLLHKAPGNNNETFLVYIREKDENFPVNTVWLKAYNLRKSGKGVTIQYAESEMLLLQYFELNETISLSKFCKLAGIPHKKAENILAAFTAIGITSIRFTHSGAVYRISGQFMKLNPDDRIKQIPFSNTD